MCLIIAKPNGKTVSSQIMESAFYGNDDSIGVGYYDDMGRQRVHRWVNPKIKVLDKVIELVDKLTWSDVLIHFRYTTHGRNSESNCHPFPLTGDALIAHNGIIPGFSCPKNKHSDTALFIDRVLKPRVLREGVVPVLKQMEGSDISKAVDPGKLCALHRYGDFYFANEKNGFWDTDGCWYSNTYSHPRQAYAAPYRMSTLPVSAKWDTVAQSEWCRSMGLCAQCGDYLNVWNECETCGIAYGTHDKYLDSMTDKEYEEWFDEQERKELCRYFAADIG